MREWIGVAGVVGVAAFTPGPNNFIVMRIAAYSGLGAAIPAIAAVVVGSLAMLTLANAGAGVALQTMPQWRLVLTAAGAAYLCLLGLRLVRGGDVAGPLEPTSVPGLLGFQFLNPKAWVMALTASAAVPLDAGPVVTFTRFAALFTLIPANGLLCWALGGTLLARFLQRPRTRAWFDRSMGGLLIASALLLLV